MKSSPHLSRLIPSIIGLLALLATFASTQIQAGSYASTSYRLMSEVTASSSSVDPQSDSYHLEGLAGEAVLTNWVSSTGYRMRPGFKLRDDLPQLSLNFSTTTGSEATTTEITITASADRAIPSAQSVDLQISGSGITADDYTLSASSIQIAAGENSGSVTFTIQDDDLAEGSETASLTLINPSAGITLGGTVSGNITITDNDYNLAFSITGSGTGTVGGSPAGIYATGTAISLSTNPSTGSYFNGWSPKPCANSFSMPAEDLNCTANFAIINHILTVQTAGTGSGTAGGTPAGSYPQGSTIILSTVTDKHSTFAGWSPSTCATAFALNANTTCTATFTLNTYTLTVLKEGTGTGIVSGSGGYPAETLVNVTATADSGSIFTGWSPELCNQAFAITENTTCSANFNNITKISAVQGSSDLSPLNTQSVTIEGIVIANFQEATQLGGFFIQEEDSDVDTNNNTSEGLFVVSTLTVAVGDKVTVTGTVAETFNMTELLNVTQLSVISSDNTLPTPAILSLPLIAITDLEAVEGMAVTMPQTLYVTANNNLGRGGFLTLSSTEHLFQPTHVTAFGETANALQAANNLNKILVDDSSLFLSPEPIVFSNNFPNPLSALDSLRIGSTVSHLQGVIAYHDGGWEGSLDGYRIHPTILPNFADTNPRPASVPSLDGTLKIATFNLSHYFTTVNDSGDICGALENQACLGADNATELNRQRDKLLASLNALNADIIGLVGLENTGQNAIADLSSALTAYHYIANPNGDGVELGDNNITLGLLFKVANVTPLGNSVTIANGFGSTDLGTACDIASDGVYPFDTYNRKPLAQSFRDINSGKSFTVVVNDFISKTLVTVYSLDTDQNDGQGLNNCSRTQAATTLIEWLASNPTASTNSNIFIMGQLNAYAKEQPLMVLDAANYINQVQTYSSIDNGQLGSLDYILANTDLNYQIRSRVKWSINADEPQVLNYNEENKTLGQLSSLYSSDVYRSAAHDPLLVGLSLAENIINNTSSAVIGTASRDLIYTQRSNRSINAGEGNDIIIAAIGSQYVTGGSGADSFAYSAMNQGLDFIMDFQTGVDTIDLHDLLITTLGYNGSNAVADGYVDFIDYGSYGCYLTVDRDGSATVHLPLYLLFTYGVNCTTLNSDTKNLKLLN